MLLHTFTSHVRLGKLWHCVAAFEFAICATATMATSYAVPKTTSRATITECNGEIRFQIVGVLTRLHEECDIVIGNEAAHALKVDGLPMEARKVVGVEGTP